MRIALIGYGRMGKAIEALALERGHEIAAIVDPAAGAKAAPRITAEAVEAADVCMEFTSPRAAADNIIALCRLNKRVVVGTTGWYDRLGEVERAVAQSNSAVLYAANFSVGVNLFFRIVEAAARWFGRLPDRDIYIYEAHHRAKVDSPSGTARRLARIVLSESGAKKSLASPLSQGPIAPEHLQVVSVRAGWIPGTHRVGIEGPHDSIILEHRAHSREGFAAGALTAAEWLATAPAGLYRFEDVLDRILGFSEAVGRGDRE